jgi:hypothetical protein
MANNVGASVSTMLTNAPLPALIEQLGIAVANAQSALDRNSIAIATQMASSEVDIAGKSYNLITLGFMPTFYAFTEATVEAKLAFSMTQSTAFEGKLSVGVNVGIVAASVEASYSRKFSMSAEGSSSIAARLVSLPPPEILRDILRREYQTEIDRTLPAPSGN